MGLHAIAADASTVTYYCTNPNCAHHSCADWEPFRTCAYHDVVEYVQVPAAELRKRYAAQLTPAALAALNDSYVAQPTTRGRRSGGTPNVVPANHPQIIWTGPDVVALPMCECGTQMFLKMSFTAEELAAPNIQMITRHPQAPTIITAINQHPMVARHQQFAAKLAALGNVFKPTS